MLIFSLKKKDAELFFTDGATVKVDINGEPCMVWIDGSPGWTGKMFFQGASHKEPQVRWLSDCKVPNGVNDLCDMAPDDLALFIGREEENEELDVITPYKIVVKEDLEELKTKKVTQDHLRNIYKI